MQAQAIAAATVVVVVSIHLGPVIMTFMPVVIMATMATTPVMPVPMMTMSIAVAIATVMAVTLKVIGVIIVVVVVSTIMRQGRWAEAKCNAKRSQDSKQAFREFHREDLASWFFSYNIIHSVAEPKLNTCLGYTKLLEQRSWL